MPFNQGIFPTSVYGQLSDSYGLPTYTSTTMFPGPSGCGLVLGQGWLLFDFSIVQLLKASQAVAANAAVTFQAGNSNPYNVLPSQSVTNVGTVPVTAINDRGGALATGGINWMTTVGLATAFCAGSLTATGVGGAPPLGSSTTVAGQLTAIGPTFYFNTALLLNNTSTAGNYPVWLQ